MMLLNKLVSDQVPAISRSANQVEIVLQISLSRLAQGLEIIKRKIYSEELVAGILLLLSK
jgi:hypothetical protein